MHRRANVAVVVVGLGLARALALAGCKAKLALLPTADGGPPPDGAGGGDGGSDRATDTGVDMGSDVGPSCSAGQHFCPGGCVSDDDVRTCGDSCSPCLAPVDGTATCNGTSCGGSCGPGKQLCSGACIAVGAACNVDCPAGTHDCGGLCPSINDVNACGATNCTPCPVPTGADQATCGSGMCGFECSTGYHRCATRCARDDDATACGTGCLACPGDTHGQATCVGGVCNKTCMNGYHLCSGTCLADNSPDSCGSMCTPCPAVPGGTRTCTAGQCGGMCPSGKMLCLGACIDAGMPCNGTCPTNQHVCNNLCVSNTAVSSCGPTSCTPCPNPTGSNGPTCNGTSCDFTCGAGTHRCGNRCAPDNDPTGCGSACTNCPGDAHGAPACVNGSCALLCQSGYHQCGNRCASNSDVATCGPTECTMACVAPANGGTVTCDGLACVPACPSGMKICNGSCVNNNVACDGNCPQGTHNCGGICQPNNSTSYCGASCTSCPTPMNGVPVCANGTCDIMCNTNFRRCAGTNACIPTGSAYCCSAAECTGGGAGTMPVCSLGNMCTYPCNTATHKLCPGSSTCVPISNCCTDTECPSGMPLCINGTCSKRPNGAPCSSPSECQSNICQICYPDRDGDGFGDMWATPPITAQCGPCASGSSANNRDCMDNPALFNAANMVNPNADFHYPSPPPGTYVPDPRDPKPDGWDWNCDDTRNLVYETMAAGCGSLMCLPGCTELITSVGPETCGTLLVTKDCDQTGCDIGGAEGLCVSRITGSVPQGCR